MRTQHIARVLLLSTFVLFLSGCQILSPVGNFIGQRYTNIASYFNTYYNSQKMFGEAETEVLTGQQAVREKAAKGQVTAYVLSSTARQKFTSSIEKNSKLLSYYPTSKFVDDALLMIGKSYYYLEEDVKAERKFLELISQYPESDLIPEAKLWYGKSLLRQKRFTEGLQLLGSLYIDAIKNKDHDIAGRAALTVGEYYFGINDYDNALQYYTQSVESLGDDVENARTQFQIGICYTKLGKIAEAEDAFHDVANFSPDYNTAFQAAVYESRMMTRQKKFDPALNNLFAKLDDTKYVEYFGTAHREVGDTYAAQGNITEAVAQYRYVDTAFARTDDAARSMFALASLYENALLRFDSARTYYDKAKVEFSASEITPDASMKSEAFGKYFNLKRDIANYDTLITEVFHPRPLRMDSASVAKRDSVHRSDSLAAVKKIQLRTDATLGLRKDTTSARTDSAAARGGAAQRTKADTLAPVRSLLAFSLSQQDSIKRADSIATIAAKHRLVDSLSRQVVRTKFEMAGLFYLELNRLDSALTYYQDVVQLTTDSSLAARAYYTMAEIYATTDSLSRPKVDSIYRKIIDIAPKSSYAQEARKSLGLPPLKEEQDSAEVYFISAEKIMTDGKAKEAIPLLRSLAAAYPRSPLAPKALYTVGWIFENTLIDNDSAEAAYKQLVDKYPGTPYSTNVQPKLAEITTAKREAEAKAKAEKDAADKIEAEKQKAEMEAKAKADAEKLKASQPVISLPGTNDTTGVHVKADSAAAKIQPGPASAAPAADSLSHTGNTVHPPAEQGVQSAPVDSARAVRGMPGRRTLKPTGSQADTTQPSSSSPR